MVRNKDSVVKQRKKYTKIHHGSEIQSPLRLRKAARVVTTVLHGLAAFRKHAYNTEK